MLSVIGGLAPLFAARLYLKFGVGWAFTLLAGIAIAFAPVPWIVYRYGEVLNKGRKRSGGVEVELSERGSREANVDAFLQTNVVGKENV